LQHDDRRVDQQAERLRVLVVDDEPSIVDVISMALRHHGYDVASVQTGAGALAEVRDWRPHAIVLDVMLPDMEGFEVARRLSAQRANVPILFLSARDNTSDKVRGLTTGGDDYVTKPFSLEELIARLRNVLRRTGTIREMSSRVIFADVELDEDTFDHG
jgi:two-component system, OmpR family, response regulator